MDRHVICAVLVLAPAHVHADGIAVIGGSPRAIGRAGAATVGDDGGGALLINPAAMARRDTARIELGVAAVDDTIEWQSAGTAAPISNAQAGSQIAPIGAAIAALGNWVLGVGVLTAGVAARQLPRPGDTRAELGSAFDYRYAGIAGSYRRDTLAIGVARRLGDSLALGLSLGASQIRVSEHRRIWAGFGGRTRIGAPESDVDVTMTAIDRFSPSAVAGLLYAPGDTPIELGASVAWADTARLDGKVIASSKPPGPTISYPSERESSLRVRQPVTVRAGGRYLGDRIVGELDGDLWAVPSAAASATWSVRGVRLTDPSTYRIDVPRIPSRISQHTHVAVRTAVDVAVIPGFLWATGGYAYSTLATPADRLSPSFGQLGGHTLGLGLETTSGGFTVTIGWSRTWSTTTRAPTALQVDNPFFAGDGPVYQGSYRGSVDQIGVLFEAELGHPDELPK